MGEIRRFKVGMSVDSLAAAWARQEAAPAGSVVTVGTEISGRRRGGVPWKVAAPEGLMMAMVTRPSIASRQESLLWLAVTLASAKAIETVSARRLPVLWPDTVGEPGDEPACCTNVGVQFGPDRIEHAVLSVRVDLTRLGPAHLDTGRAAVVDGELLLAQLIDELDTAVARLETEPQSVLQEFGELYELMDRVVSAKLLPRGSARGRVAAIDPNGDLVLESPTGMLERIMAANLHSLTLV